MSATCLVPAQLAQPRPSTLALPELTNQSDCQKVLEKYGGKDGKVRALKLESHMEDLFKPVLVCGVGGGTIGCGFM